MAASGSTRRPAGLVTAAGPGPAATIAAGSIGVVSLLLVAAGLLIEKARAPAGWWPTTAATGSWPSPDPVGGR
jgi:hypothetical protein